jgi:hypothetical protein
MSQSDMNIANQGFPAFRADLNAALEALASNSSGATAPSATFPHQFWVDTSASPSVLKQRNLNDDAWVTIGTINEATGIFTLDPGAVDAYTRAETNTALELKLNVGNPSYTGTLTGGTGVINIGSGQFYKNASGNVGIGTSSPAQKLDVAGNILSSGFLRMTDDGTAAVPSIQPGNDGNTGFFRPGTDIIGVSTGGNERMRINSSGNLLVGTTVDGGVGYSLLADAAGRSAISNTSFNGFVHISYRYSGTEVGRISTSTTATSYVTSSDYRLKHDIQPMTGALAKVAQLKPVTYKWNADDSQSQGFIAHELQEVVPECVTGEKDAVDAEGNPQYQGIDTSFLSATLVSAIQEQQAIITALTARVAALEAK